VILRLGLTGVLGGVGQHLRPQRAPIYAVVILVLLVMPSPAGAVVTFGSNLSRPANIGHGVSGSDATEGFGAMPATSLAAGGKDSPMAGVIVRWRIKMGSTTTAVALRVIRPGDSTTATGAGTGETVTPSANTTSELAARLPVQSGDGIGVNWADGQTLTARSDTPGATILAWFPLLDSAPPSPASTSPSRELLINADVEPDADGDGFGDETQDQCPTNASTQGPCPVTPAASVTGQRAAALKKCKKKAKKNHWSKKKLKKCKKKAKLLPV
jgi:hypothetical protein